MYKAETRGISVTVQPRFVEEESSPGDEQVQLRSRHWRIIDGRGACQEVRGTGVVGKQPVLEPGESFCYTSGCPLTTPDGLMAGSYTMATVAGDSFEAEIPAFSLDSPHVRRSLH